MLGDRVRLHRYAAALKCCLRPGAVVVDLGAGTGVFGFLACGFGATKVYAIEAGGSITLARALAEDNALAGRIEFIHDWSTRVSLPEHADLIIADLRGAMPMFAGGIAAMVDARRRLLKDGGTIIPARDDLWVTLVDLPDVFAKLTQPWRLEDMGLDLRRAERLCSCGPVKVRADRETCVADTRAWGSIDYSTVEQGSIDGAVSWRINADCSACGLLVWFSTVLCANVGFDAGPDGDANVYGQLFLPWPRRTHLAAGSQVEVKLAAIDSGRDYVWSWATRVDTGECFDQCSLPGPLLTGTEHRRDR